MDFFASQDLARRKSKWLIFYFILAVISMIIGIYLVVMVAIGFTSARESGGLDAQSFFNPGILFAVTGAVILVVGGGSLYKVSALRGGGESVATMLGGRLAPPNSQDRYDRRILNVVEEMALAAGTPVPPVYVMDNEPGINAFAAGYTVDDAVIGVNRGTIELLTRDELQGVVAHEFSHILNGDMRMSIRMMGVLHGIQILSLIGYYMLYSTGRGSRRNDKGGGAAILAIGLGVLVIGSVGLFFARIIKAMVSRQREYLADASAVQFTRNPDGISGALKMIGASVSGSVVENPTAEEASHMFFASMFKSNFSQMFATHPPLDQRIQAIDPQFNGSYAEFARERMERKKRREAAEKKQAEKKTKLGLGMPGGSGMPAIMGDQFPIDPAILIAGIGLPDNDDVEYSEMIVDRIPGPLAEAARDVFSSRCIVFASLLNKETKVRRTQLQAIATGEGQATIDETIRLMPLVDQLEPRFRLPIFEILQGTLTGISPEQYDVFCDSVDRLVKADQKVDLFEFFLKHHLLVHLDRRFGRVRPPKVVYRNADAVQAETCLLIAVIVRVGHSDLDVARGAFSAAIDSLGKPWGEEIQRIEDRFGYRDLERALEKLKEASPKIKKSVLTAIAVAVTFDKIITIEEAELFRAISESLDCPVPPVVATD